MASLYDPSPIQQEFHLCPADEILFAGSAGPGKSLALLMDPIQTQLFFEHERWRKGQIQQSEGWAIHFRREFPMLAQTLDRAHRFFPKIDQKVHWNGDSYTFTFQCGYKIQFGHMKNLNDWQNYDSNQYTHLAFDEVVQFEKEQYEALRTRVRSSDPEMARRKRVVSATNPSGNWVREMFVDPCPEGRRLMVTKLKMDDGSIEKRTRIFIPATLKDNPDAAFRRDYERTLQGAPEHIRKARLYGDWYVIAGAFYINEWDPKVHIVEPFKLPSGWTRFRSGDWGYKSPGCVHWWAVDTDGNLTCYREYTFQNTYVDDVARKIREIEIADGVWDEKRDCSKLTGPLDTQAWEQRGQRGPTMAEVMANHGVYWTKCEKNKYSAVQQFIRRLKQRDRVRKDADPIPGIRFFHTCRNAIKTIPALGTSETDAELPADGGPDHWHDSVLYACSYRSLSAESDVAPAKRDYEDDLELQRKKRRQSSGGRHGYGYW